VIGLCVCICVYVYVCVCMCVRARERRSSLNVLMCILTLVDGLCCAWFIYIYISCLVLVLRPATNFSISLRFSFRQLLFVIGRYNITNSSCLKENLKETEKLVRLIVGRNVTWTLTCVGAVAQKYGLTLSIGPN
jgi:hypothetical protein